MITISLCFFEDPLRVLGEVERCLTVDGRIIICFIPRDSSWGRYYEELGRKGHDFYRYARFYTLDEVEDMLRSMDFAVKEIYATLSAPPEVRPHVEEPSQEIDNRSFICLSAAKSKMDQI